MVTAPGIPGHRVSGVLGAGGFATVYRCWQLAVGREVAVKVDNRVLFTERDRRRFIREVTAAGRLSGHPHVIDVYDAGTLEDGRPFLVMELCPAGSLNDALRKNGPMPVAQVRDVGIRLADALAAAHASGVLHRDIKPANILVNRFGMVGLSDFGLASIVSAHGDQTASREALTPAFSSPETFRGEEPTVLADVYSLAATLYTLLSGRPPRFPADGRLPSFATIMMLHGAVPSARHLQGGPAAMPTGSAGQAESTGTARGVSARHAGMAAGLIVIIVAALVTGARFFPHGASGGSNGTSSGGMGGTSSGARPGGAVSAANVFGIVTKSAGCPAAALRVATARCPATPECFNGLTVISGAASTEQLPCNGPHVWETFAIAILPAEVHTFDQPMVAADPTVQRVCSEAVMLASRQGPARRDPAPDWDIQVLPPSEAAYDSGSRVYRCLANEIGHEPRTSQFRR